MRTKTFWRVGLAVVLSMTMIWSGCSTNWIQEAEQIVAAMIPAAANLVALVAALQGKTVSAADLQVVQSAGAQVGADLQLIQALLAAYEKADAAAKPGILNQIQSAIGAAQGNLQGLLPALHIKDAATQTKVQAVVGILLAEVQSLAAVVPLVQGNRESLTEIRQVEKGGQYPHPVRDGRMRPSLREQCRPLSAQEFVESYDATLTAKTGNADLDRASSGLRIYWRGRAERVASVGILK